MINGDLTELKICLGKLDYLSFALRNLSSSNGYPEAKDFRDNVAHISRLLEGQMRWLSRNWPSLAVVLRDNNQPDSSVHKV
jgi:hypothetical protein